VYVRVVAPPACVYPVDPGAGVFIEAEGSSRHAGPFRRVDELGRGNDAFVQVDPAASSSAEVPDEANVMWYDLDVANGGSTYLWVLGNGPSSASDTFFVSVNGGPDQVVTLAPAAWAWTRAETALDLPSGKQTLKIKAAKPGAQLDRIWLTSQDDAVAPNGLGDATPDTPCSKGQVFDPPNGGSGGMGGAGGAGMTAGGAGGQVPAGGSALGGGAGASVGIGASNGGGAKAAAGCGCRVGSPSGYGAATLGLLGILSALCRRRFRRGGCAR
jgi:hypothetical protein